MSLFSCNNCSASLHIAATITVPFEKIVNVCEIDSVSLKLFPVFTDQKLNRFPVKYAISSFKVLL